MAIEKQINIVVKETGLDSVQKQVNSLDNSLEDLSSTQKGLVSSMKGSTNSVLENGGAMGLLNDATGGLAMTVKDAVEASVLFTKSQKVATITQGIYTTVVGTSTGAMKAFRIALASTGIGAIVIALVALIANFDKVKKAVLNVVPGLAKVGEFIGNIIENVTDFIGITSEAERALADLTAQADKSLAMNKKFVQEQGDILNEYTKAKIDAKNRYLEAIKEEGADQTALANRLNRELVAIDKKHNDDLAKLRKEKQDKIDDEAEKAREKKRIASEKEIAEEKARLQKLADEKLALDMKSAEDAINILNQLKENVETPAQKEQREFEEKKAILEANNLSTEELTKQHLENLAKITADENAIKIAKEDSEWLRQQELTLKKNEYDKLVLTQKFDAEYLAAEGNAELQKELKRKLNEDLAGIDKEAKEKEIALENSVKDAKVDIANQTLNLISEIAGKGSKVGKAVAIAQATLSGVQGVQNAFTTASASPITTVFPAYPFIQAGLAGAFSAVQIAKLAKGEKASGGSSGGGGSAGVQAPSAPSFNLVQGTGTNQIAQGLANQTQPLKAYVVGSDVTNQQQLDRNIVQGATLGG